MPDTLLHPREAALILRTWRAGSPALEQIARTTVRDLERLERRFETIDRRLRSIDRRIDALTSEHRVGFPLAAGRHVGGFTAMLGGFGAMLGVMAHGFHWL